MMPRSLSIVARLGLSIRDVALFSSDIAENIRYSRPSATNEDVEIASQRAGLYEMVQSAAGIPDTGE